MTAKPLTKSRFKLAHSCIMKLYYSNHCNEIGGYKNQMEEDDFVRSLAEGGFQVGELAKIYCEVPKENDLENLIGEDAIIRTKELLKQENVNIAEAAFQYKNMYVRVDILEKRGTHINLKEVKAKSWDENEDSFFGKKKKNTVFVKIKEYLYDVTFQKYVVVNALQNDYPSSDYSVTAFLMMADKTKVADIDGLNQMFKICRNGNKSCVERMPDVSRIKDSKVHILTAFPVDEYCDKIIAGDTDEQQKDMGCKFIDFVNLCSDLQAKDQQPEWFEIGSKCYKCEFYTNPNEKDFKDGYKECWKKRAGFSDADFEKPLLKELWGAYMTGENGSKNALITNKQIYFLDEITKDEIVLKTTEKGGLHHTARKWLQIGFATKNQDILNEIRNLYGDNIQGNIYLDKDGIRDEMASWIYPLHMIDFETTAVALPFYEGMRPYEQVAFQFSHHMIYEDGRIEHVGQYLNTKKGFFPNFEFVRELKRQLEKDNGTIFRYSNHENTILNKIAEQLAFSHEVDKQELIEFIMTITHDDDEKNKTKKRIGERDMVDLWDIVKKYYMNYDEMKGSNSIKQVLPAVLNSSKYLQEKYSMPIYGSEIKSCNYTSDSPIAWVRPDENGYIDSPYHQLKSLGEISKELGVSEVSLQQYPQELEDEEESIANGGAALVAYSKLQFSDGIMSDILREALLRYCELDTMSMVFIWEYFYDECIRKR